MESAELNLQKIHVISINIGEDVLKTVEAYVLEKGIKQAVILNGYGALTHYQLHWVLHNQLPSKPVFGGGEGGVELVSMSGIVVESKPHIHVALATQGGAFGGHMEEGCIAYVICEVFLAEIAGPHLGHVRLPVSMPGMGDGTTYHLTVKPQD